MIVPSMLNKIRASVMIYWSKVRSHPGLTISGRCEVLTRRAPPNDIHSSSVSFQGRSVDSTRRMRGYLESRRCIDIRSDGHVRMNSPDLYSKDSVSQTSKHFCMAGLLTLTQLSAPAVANLYTLAADALNPPEDAEVLAVELASSTGTVLAGVGVV